MVRNSQRAPPLKKCDPPVTEVNRTDLMIVPVAIILCLPRAFAQLQKLQ